MESNLVKENKKSIDRQELRLKHYVRAASTTRPEPCLAMLTAELCQELHPSWRTRHHFVA